MIPDRLSIPGSSKELLQTQRLSAPVQEEQAAFASLYAEALQSAEQTISELGSVDTSDTASPGSDDLLGFLELRSACLPGASAAALEEDCGAHSLGAPGQRLSSGGELSLEIGSDASQLQTGCAQPGIGRLIDWLDSHAELHSTHRCAAAVRQAMQAAGISTADRPASGAAGDYGPFLLRHGAQIVPPDNYQPQAGDVAVFDKTPDHPNGHVQVFDGQRWVSDFLQRTFSPYRDQQTTPPVTVYRMS